MPHKRNPVALASLLTASIRVPGLVGTMLTAASSQEHERALGGWPAEWSTFPELCITTQSALETLAHVLDGLTVNSEVMHENLGRTDGLLLAEAVSMALAEKLGRHEAHRLVHQLTLSATHTGATFRTVLVEDTTIQQHLPTRTIDKLLDPGNYLGSSQAIIQRVLQTYRARSAR